jgi:hypothetical protein
MKDEIVWRKIGPLSGTIHAEMVAEVLEERNIPHFVSQDWFSGALGVKAVSAVGNTAFIFVPEEQYEEVLALVEEMFGDEQ